MMRGLALVVSVLTACGPNGSIDGSSTLPGTKKDPESRTADANGVGGVESAVETSFDLTKCGYSISSPTTVLQSQKLTMTPTIVTATVSVLIFESKKDVTMSGTFVSESSLEHQTMSYSSTPSSNADAPEVAAFVASNKGAGEATLIDINDRAKIGEKNPEWAGLFCTLQPAIRMETSGSQHVVAEFSQPVPYGLIVTGDAVRMKAELSTKHSWTNIVAKIVESTNPSAPVGTALTGSAVLEPVVGGVGSGDLAVKLTYNFGGADKNRLLGLPANITWSIDSANRTIKSVQMDSGSGKSVIFK